MAHQTHPIIIKNTVLYPLHIGGEQRTNGGAACKEEVHHQHLTGHIFDPDRVAKLVDELERKDVVILMAQYSGIH